MVKPMISDYHYHKKLEQKISDYHCNKNFDQKSAIDTMTFLS
jgi:hypothetical protein